LTSVTNARNARGDTLKVPPSRSFVSRTNTGPAPVPTSTQLEPALPLDRLDFRLLVLQYGEATLHADLGTGIEREHLHLYVGQLLGAIRQVLDLSGHHATDPVATA
jgi:hypothetical protein